MLHIEAIFQDNKRPRAMALKAELRNLKLGDLSIDGYFQKIESIVSVLNGLGSPFSNDDVVTFTLEGLPSTYETISTVIVSREPFPDLKMVRSLLTTHEMRLKSRVYWLNPTLVLGMQVYFAPSYLGSGSASSVPGVTRSDLDMLQSLLAKFGLDAPNISTPSPPVAYTVFVPPGNGRVIPTRGSVSDEVTTAGGPLSTTKGFDAFWSTARGSPCTWSFTAASLVYDSGSTAAKGFFPWFGSLGTIT
ncbi:ribonuclease H-like domain-containing protein [Tanacetum coccineum]